MVLEFEPPIQDEETYLRVMQTLHQMHPELKWLSEAPIEPGIPIHVRKRTGGIIPVYHLHIEGNVLTWDDFSYKTASGEEIAFVELDDDVEIINGWEYLTGSVNDVFNKLYESDYKQKRVTLEFIPPILDRESYLTIMRELKRKHPELKWNSGADATLYVPNFLEFPPEKDEIYYFHIYDNSRITWSSTTEKEREQGSGPDISDRVVNGWDYINVGNIDDIFQQLYEQKEDEFEWARESLRNYPFHIGDVFYIVDGHIGEVKPDDYRPLDVRYIVTIADIIPAQNPDKSIIKYKPCDPNNVTYNPKDYSIESTRCYDYEDDDSDELDENGYQDIEADWLVSGCLMTKYWRPMGNSIGNLNESEEDEFEWAREAVKNYNTSIVGRPFHIDTDGSLEQYIEVQEWLFSLGFTMGGEQRVELESGITSIQSIWPGNVKNKTLTRSSRWPYENSIEVTRNHKMEDPLYINWSDFRSNKKINS